MRHTSFDSPSCIFNALAVRTCGQSKAFRKALTACVPGNMWARMMGKSVSISLCPTGSIKQALVSRQMLP